MSESEEDWDAEAAVVKKPKSINDGNARIEDKCKAREPYREFNNRYKQQDRYNKARQHYREFNDWNNKDRKYCKRDYHERGCKADCIESLNIRSEQIGRIIGRAGANIRNIESDYDVEIDLQKTRNCLFVTGSSSKTVSGAIDHIKSMLSDNDSYDAPASKRVYNDERKSNYDRRDNYAYNDRASTSSKATDSYAQPEPEADILDDNGAIDYDKLKERAEKARNERWAKCPPLSKNFYREAVEVANMTPEEVKLQRKENNDITVQRIFKEENAHDPQDIPNPISNFSQCFADYPDLIEQLSKQNFKNPTPIQCQAWPVLLKGEDLIGIAQTGTGKTLAFLLPAMIHTEMQSVPRGQRGGPNVLIMAPTRELALQIEKEVNKYSFRGMKAVCVYGGGDRREQIKHLEGGVEIIICTPGRLNDLITAKVINIESVTFLILDEADRMLDMGFEPQIRKVLLDIRPDRQTVMTSATWPPGVRRLAESYTSNPIQVCVGSLDLAATQTVKQIIEIIDENDKKDWVRRFLKKLHRNDKVIIFMGKKARADDLSSDLTMEGFYCAAIHGSLNQSTREQAIQDISTGYIPILIATDLASRGLDIEDITYVLNYDFPRNIEEYVHRVGRTGRAGRSGTSISLITRSDWNIASELIEILEKGVQEVPIELRRMADRFAAKKLQQTDGRGRGRGGGFRNFR